MAKFLLAYENTKPWEGGYSCDEPDNGNWTSGKVGIGECVGTIAGITAYEVQEVIGRKPTIGDMKHFPEEERLKIYKKKYWDVVRGDEIDSQEIANQIYDEQVNAGGNGIKLAYEIVGLPPLPMFTDELLNAINA